MIQEISKIRFHRAIVPSDTVNLDIETIYVADASPFIICVAIYARFKRRNGQYFCQLVFARTKIVPKDRSMPRAELLAATHNATTGHVVKVYFEDKHKYCWKITDSPVVLYWINSTRSTLKMWVRNRIIEIQRLANHTQWKYEESKNNIADIGTRKGAKLCDVGPCSDWTLGKRWMRGNAENFPLKAVADLVLSPGEEDNASKESIVVEELSGPNTSLHVPKGIGEVA